MNTDQIAAALGTLFLPVCFFAAGFFTNSNRQLALRIIACGIGVSLLLFVPLLTAALVLGLDPGRTFIGSLIGSGLLVMVAALVAGLWRGRSWAMLLLVVYAGLGLIVALRAIIQSTQPPAPAYLMLLSCPFALRLAMVHLLDTITAAQASIVDHST